MPRRNARSALALVLSAALALAPLRLAAAPQESVVTVWTRSGGVYRGEIVARVPGESITLRLATGETLRIEWKDVERDSMGPSDGVSPRTPDATDAPSEASAPPAVDGVRVHLEGDGDLLLMREAGVSGMVVGGMSTTFARQELACRAPCDLVVPRGGGYRVAAFGRRTSAPFSLDGDARTIHASLGSSAGHQIGVASTVFGLTFLLSGALTYGILRGVGLEETMPSSDQRNPGYTTAYAFIGVGAVVGLLGVVLWAANGSSVEVDGAAVAARRRPSGFALTPTGFVF